MPKTDAEIAEEYALALAAELTIGKAKAAAIRWILSTHSIEVLSKRVNLKAILAEDLNNK